MTSTLELQTCKPTGTQYLHVLAMLVCVACLYIGLQLLTTAPQ